MNERFQLIRVFVVLMVSLVSAQAQLSFFPLGDLTGGATNSAAYGVSADGHVVVGSSVSATGVTAFMWTEGGGMIALPMLPGGTSATAHAVSADGQIIVGGGDSASGMQAGVWSNGTVSGLGDLAGGSFSSVAKDVSDNGQVIVGYGTSASGREAFRWVGGVMTGLGDLAGGSHQSEARAVTPNGALVTGYGTVSGQNIFTWDATNNLQDYYSSAQAYDVSSDGNNFAGHINTSYTIPEIITINYRRAARWNGGAIDTIGPQSTGQFVDSLFYGMTPDSSIAVGSFKSSSAGPYFAVSHDYINSVRNLKTELVTNGIDMTGWELTAATAISADGSVIVGYGTNPDGNQEAWVIKGYSLDLTLRWIGNNAHWPANDALTDADDLWMNVDSKDPNIAVTGIVVFSSDKGDTWTNAPLIEGTPGPDYDHWYQNLGSFPAGTTIRYRLAVEDIDGNQIWDDNQGRDHYAVVSPGYTGTVEWIGNDGANGTTANGVTNRALAFPPALIITNIGQNMTHLSAQELVPGHDYALEMGGDLMLWTNVTSISPAGTNDSVSVTNSLDTTFFRLTTPEQAMYVFIERETWPQDSGKAARTGYRIDAGDWQTIEMSCVGPVGNNDLWRSEVGPVSSGGTVEYFIEVISAASGGFPHYDNNNNSNYVYSVP